MRPATRLPHLFPPHVTRALVAIVALAGGLILLAPLVVRWQIGADDASARARIGAALTSQLEATAARLQRLSDTAVTRLEDGGHDDAAPSEDALWRALADVLSATQTATDGLTVYGAGDRPMAWAGHVSGLPRPVVGSLRLLSDRHGVRVTIARPVTSRGATLVLLAEVEVSHTLARTADGLWYHLPSPVGPVRVRPLMATAPPESTTVSLGRDRVLTASLPATAIDAARTRLWRRCAALALLIVALGGAVVAAKWWRMETPASARLLRALCLLVALGVVLLGAAAVLVVVNTESAVAAGIIGVSALVLVGSTELVAAWHRRSRTETPWGRWHWTVAPVLWTAAGVGATVADVRWVVHAHAVSGLRLSNVSLHPFHAQRLLLVVAVLAVHGALLWMLAAAWPLTTRGVSPAQGGWGRRLARGAAVVGGGLVVLWLWARPEAAAAGSLLVGGAVIGILWGRSGGPAGGRRRGDRATALAAGILVTVVAAYPATVRGAAAATNALVSGPLAAQVLTQRDRIQGQWLSGAMRAVDSTPDLVARLARSAGTSDDPSALAFDVWMTTGLAEADVTSSIDIYDRRGTLVSHFGIHEPDFARSGYLGGACGRWDVVDEGTVRAGTAVHALRAGRAVCDGSIHAGAIAIRVQLDFSTVPQVGPPRPFPDSLLSTDPPSAEDALGRDVAFASYGWSGTAWQAPARGAWSIPNDVFEQLSAARVAVWHDSGLAGRSYHVYWFSDRGGIYALGYPLPSAFDHAVVLAETLLLVGVCGVIGLLGWSVLWWSARPHWPIPRRGLTFHQRVIGTMAVGVVVPVMLLAWATSSYLATQLRADVDASALRSAVAAQRVLEDTVSLQTDGPFGIDRIDDDVLLLLRRSLGVDMNVYVDASIHASSQRALFASGLVSPRLPAEVYQRTVLDHAPALVTEQRDGRDGAYLLAAAPIQIGSVRGIVTVPQTLRQRDIEAQIDEWDRRLVAAVVLLLVFGAPVAVSLTRRITTPVHRLSAAMRRVADGDFDARVASDTADELGQLVSDFNRMAEDLATQRQRLASAKRLEAWADMARQLAHDIKNPLTPIQLAAEHAVRVNQDRGGLLSPELDRCVATILRQVDALRALSLEFSSFATAPTVQWETVDLGDVVRDVVEPYRGALPDAIRLHTQWPSMAVPWRTDARLLHRAMANLVENAVHAMPRGGTLSVVLDLQTPTSATLRVSDTGGGMTAEDIARAFEPYFSTRTGGTGLGLTIVKRNIELLGGTVRIDSRPGAGSTVTVALGQPSV